MIHSSFIFAVLVSVRFRIIRYPILLSVVSLALPPLEKTPGTPRKSLSHNLFPEKAQLLEPENLPPCDPFGTVQTLFNFPGVH